MDLDRWQGQIRIWIETHENIWGWVGLLSGITLIGTLVTVLLVLILLPQDYLTQDRMPTRSWPPLFRIPYLAVKNAFGGFLIMAGLAMIVLPGQGLLTLLIGLVLVDLPGKHHLILRIVRQRKVFHYINWLRAKANKPPLEDPHRDR